MRAAMVTCPPVPRVTPPGNTGRPLTAVRSRRPMAEVPVAPPRVKGWTDSHQAKHELACECGGTVGSDDGIHPWVVDAFRAYHASHGKIAEHDRSRDARPDPGACCPCATVTLCGQAEVAARPAEGPQPDRGDQAAQGARLGAREGRPTPGQDDEGRSDSDPPSGSWKRLRCGTPRGYLGASGIGPKTAERMRHAAD